MKVVAVVVALAVAAAVVEVVVIVVLVHLCLVDAEILPLFEYSLSQEHCSITDC